MIATARVFDARRLKEPIHLERWNGVPFKDADGNVIGLTCNARLESGYVVVDIEPIATDAKERGRPGGC